MNLPQFLLVGTAKAGTTSLYHYLSQHDDVAIPVKETFYFLKDIYRDNHLEYPKQRPLKSLILNENEYKKTYAGLGDKVLAGEIGTGYLYHHEVAIPLIKETLGDPKILIMLRNPVTRCFSSHMHFVKDLHENLSFKEALAQEAKRKDEGWDFMWHHKSVGLYCNQVKAYLEAFSNVKVIIAEEFAQERHRITNEIFDFLEISQMDEFKNLKTFNPSGVPKNTWLQRFITQENRLKAMVRPLFRMAFSKEKRAKIRKSVKAKNLDKSTPIPSDIANDLMEFYDADIKKLEKLLGRDLSIWLDADFS